MHSQTNAPTVLRQKIAHGRRYGNRSAVYMAMVHKWRFHFYGVIHNVFENADEFDFPIVFTPLERYLDGFEVEYHAITDLPQNILSDLRASDEVEEGWNFIHNGVIHIFYDPNVHPTRMRFTLGHEWGHVFQKLDWEFKSDMEAIPDPRERKEIIESVADHFSAYYLVPFPLLKRHHHSLQETVAARYLPSSLAQVFNVSVPVITNSMTNFRSRLKQ